MSDHSTPPSRGRTIAVRILTIITAAVFAMAGFSKISGAEQMVSAFNAFGFPPWFMTLVGIAEVVGAIGLLLPPIAALAGLGLMGIAGGAFITHIASGDSFGMAVPAIVVFVLAAVVTLMRGKKRHPHARQHFSVPNA
ncbi:MAG: DoxX family protein [Alphaproteobacteria bacterium]